MKKTVLICLAAIACAANAETITMDLATAIDAAGNVVTYDDNDVMDSLYSTNDLFAPFFYTNDGVFFVSHLPSGESWDGTSWEGFALSKKNTATGNLMALECTAKGGLKGEGTPFLLGYYSEYFTNNSADYPSSNIVLFNDTYCPTEVSICQSSNTLKAITEGMGVARAFTDKDALALIITGIDSDFREITPSVIYYLAVDGKYNSAWEKVNLSAIGNCSGLSFRMTSTDTGTWGINTPTYFAMDGLIISNTPTALAQTEKSAFAAYMHDGRIEIENAETPVEVYSLQGHRLLTTTATHIDMATWPNGIYLVKCGHTVVKIVK